MIKNHFEWWHDFDSWVIIFEAITILSVLLSHGHSMDRKKSIHDCGLENNLQLTTLPALVPSVLGYATKHVLFSLILA